MSGNSFGQQFKLTTFGESHGPSIGGVIEGCPAGLQVNIDFIQSELDKRRPGSTELGTDRSEEDKIEILSGLFEGKTTGTPIGFIILNKDARLKDYDQIKDVYRPSHADYTYDVKYGIRDYRGGGRASARETACRVVAGALAKLLLKQSGVDIFAYVSSIGEFSLKKDYKELDLKRTYESSVRCPDPHMETFMIRKIEKVRKEGDSIGGTISCVVKDLPAGLGEPVFDKLQAVLAHAIMSINAVKGFEYGTGFSATLMTGSEHNDEMIKTNQGGEFNSNKCGGIQGGISNGEDIYFRAAFKPVASISKKQKTVNQNAQQVELELKGRHDPCVLPRAVAIVEAMTALVLADFLLLSKLNKL